MVFPPVSLQPILILLQNEGVQPWVTLSRGHRVSREVGLDEPTSGALQPYKFSDSVNGVVHWMVTVKKLLPLPAHHPHFLFFVTNSRVKEKGNYSQNCQIPSEDLDLLLSSCTACLPWYHAILLVRICLSQQWPTLADLVSGFSWLRDCSLILWN